MCALVKEREERERERHRRNYAAISAPTEKRSKGERKKNGIKANRAESLKTSLKDKVLTRLESVYSSPPFTELRAKRRRGVMS